MRDATKHTEQSPLAHAILSSIAGAQLPHSEQTDMTLLDVKAVSALVGVRTGTVKQWVRAKTFPAPVRISSRCSRWALGSVKAWLQFQLYAKPGDTFIDLYAEANAAAQAQAKSDDEAGGAEIAISMLSDISESRATERAAVERIRQALAWLFAVPHREEAISGFSRILAEHIVGRDAELQEAVQ